MELVPSERFLAWAMAHEIAPDERYQEPRCLVFAPARDFDRFWTNPKLEADWPGFLQRILCGVEQWSGGMLWPRGGQAYCRGYSDRAASDVKERALEAAGIPVGFAGAVRFEQRELGELQTLMLAYMAIAWHTGDDVFIVPESGERIVWLDHHEVIHVGFSRKELVAPFVSHMADGGFPLPTELPDETFKRPNWL